MEINENNASIKGYLDNIVALTDNASSRESWISELEAELRKAHNELKADMSSNLADLQRKYNNTCNAMKWKDDKIKELESKVEEQINKDRSARILFEPEIIQVVQNEVQFYGLPDEDPYGHINHFLQICDIFKINGVSDDSTRLILFPFSLRDKARLWLRSLPGGSVTDWYTMSEKFLSEYFPRSKAVKLRREISSFSQMDGECLYESWRRFKDLLRRCPTHGMPLWCQVETFYSGLSRQTMRELDAAARGALTSKPPKYAFDLIEKMAKNDYQWQDITNKPVSTRGVHQVEAMTYLIAKLEALTYRIDQMQVNAFQVSCELCGGPHPSRDCHEEADYNNTDNPSWRNHPNSCQEYQQY